MSDLVDEIRSRLIAAELKNEVLERLLERAVRNAGRLATVTAPRWAHVKNVFAVGSTRARDLCKRFGLDPEEPRP